MKRTLPVAVAVFAVLALAGCGGAADDPGAADATTGPTTGPTTAAAEPLGPVAGTATATPDTASPGARTTLAAEDVTDADKQKCLDAMLTQLREKKGGDMPAECAVLPDSVLGPLVDQALSGG